MTYPQTPSTQPVLQSGDYYRLLTTLACPGDTYESEESGYAIAIGPLSDIARVNVGYFDPTAPSNMRIVQVTNKAPLIGRVNARPVQDYSPPDFGIPAGNVDTRIPARGRVLFSIGDNVPQFNVAGSNAGMESSAAINTVPPVLDLIQYFQQSASLPTVRNDRKYSWYQVPAPYTINLPFFGRSWGMISCTGDNAQPVGISGLRFTIGSPVTPLAIPIRASAAIGAGGFVQVIDTNVLGEFDYIRIDYAAGHTGIAPTNVIFSDLTR